MEIEKLIERLQNWDGIKPDREIDCAIEGLKALQAENDRLQAELEKQEATRKKQADILYELRGQKYEQTTAIDRLRAENDRLRRERDDAVKDIWVPRWKSCKFWPGCDYISAVTGFPDCAGCGEWTWRGFKGGMSMERLTKKVHGVWIASCKYGNSPFPIVTQEIIDRLAAYEDTGLTPEEVQQMRWIPVEERLPDKPGHYLVCTNVNYWHGGCMDKNGASSNAGTTDGYAGTTLSVLDCFYDITGDWNRVCNAHVTHWMPLPAAPKEASHD